MNDPVPAPVRALLELYSAELPEVRFPDVDAETLAAAAAELTRRTEQVAAAEAALEQARRAESEAFDALLSKARRALAYVKVYAEDRPALQARLESIALKASRARAESAPKPKEVEAKAKDAEAKPAKAEAKPAKVAKVEAPISVPPTRAVLQAALASPPAIEAKMVRGRGKGHSKNGHAG